MTNDAPEQVLILTRGIPASGKSTWARAWQAEDPTWRVRVNRDDLRVMLAGTAFFPELTRRHQEETVTLNQVAMVEANLRAKMSVVLDDTNLTHRFVKDWLRLAQKLGVKVEFVDFNISLDEALARNKKRGDEGGHFVPEDAVRSFYQRFVNKKTGKLNPYPVLDPTFEPVVRPYVPLPDKPRAVLVDIDGTVADMGPCGRGPFEWHRVGEDSPISGVIEWVRFMAASGVTIIFMSGRDEVSREATLSWLREHVVNGFWPDWQLHMRPENDTRGDEIVKAELFWKHVGENYNVIGVFDDRNKVVAMWRKMGLAVAQMADGDF